jgi:hypothetical protein
MTKKCYIIRTIVAFIGFASFLFVLGIVGGIEHGEPLINALMAIPAMALVVLCAWLLDA